MAEAPPGTAARMELWSAVPGSRRPVLRTCGDETAEAEAVCDSVLAHRDAGVALHDQAVLFRASHHADLLELELVRRNVPYVKYGGLKFLEAAHVKDLMALLRVLDNPCDELAWFRILQLLEGVGAATARRCMGEIGLPPDRANGAVDPALTPLARFLAAPVALPAPARPELSELRAALADCADGCLPGGDTPPVGAQVERLVRWLAPVVERVYAFPAPRIDDLRRLEQVATAGAASRGRFVADLTLDPPRSTSDLAGPPLLDEDWLVLSTVHSAKGGEWDVVHLLHASDGMFPSDMATGDADGIDEERRLLYVAVTRARHVLEVNAPLRYHHARPNRLADAHSYAQVSRFLTPAVRARMDAAHTGRQSSPDDGRAGAAEGPDHGLVSVDSLLAGLWS
jgi:DNA helicase II / ATP-dependent DNA helicase PcrA